MSVREPGTEQTDVQPWAQSPEETLQQLETSPDGLPDAAVTVSFLTIDFTQRWHVLNIRAPESPRFNNEIKENAYVWGALVLCTVILTAVLYIPTTARVLAVARPSFEEWLCILVGSSMSAVVGLFRPRRSPG